jgi:hypothetical protein
MTQIARHIIRVAILILLLENTAIAQRISFGTYATDDIVLTPLNLGELDFSQKQSIILAGQTISINMVDDAVAVLAIEARVDLNITVTVDAPAFLSLDVTNQIPLVLNFAYSNNGAATDGDAKKNFIQVPNGFTSITFPVLRRASGLPAPPPTPDHSGYTASRRTAYLFIFGTLGPVPANAAAGSYYGNINIRVEYAK